MSNISRKSIIVTVVRILMLCAILASAPIFAKTNITAECKTFPFAGGSGSDSDPFQVADPVQLDSVRNYPDSCFIQIADIDLDLPPYNAGTGWEPVGNYSERFTGSYDGGGYKILNLLINDSLQDYSGLFGYVESGDLENIHLSGAYVKGGSNTGCLAGNHIGGTNRKCSSSGTVKGGYSDIGGLIGYGAILLENAFSDADVTGYEVVGGLVGYIHGEIRNSAAFGDVTGTFGVGGLAGFVHYGVTDSYATGAVSGNDTTGGLTGATNGGAGSWIIRSYSTGLVTGVIHSGGLTGYHDPVVIVNDSFYDSETSNMSDSGWGEPKTTAEMKTLSTFTDAGWDFTTPAWKIDPLLNGGYPYLEWQVLPYPPTAPQNIETVINGEYLIISWEPVTGASGYKIYSSDDPYGSFTEDNSGSFDGVSWTVSVSHAKKFYYVAAY